MFDIKENLKKLPTCPGVYLHKDELGNIIYVGKAINLRNRVRQYFQSQKNMAPKVRSMVSQIAEFEYITAGSEMEALILECNLIKKHRPKYNILLRDDKTYPYIKVTNDTYPRVIKTRVVKKDGGKYFGPYSDVGAVNSIIDLLNASFTLKRCSASDFPKGYRPCLNYHIKQCRGICSGEVSPEEYREAVNGAVDFLSGRSNALLNSLKTKMMAASEAMEYEEAAVYRDYIEAAKALTETQRVVIHHSEEADIVLPARTNEDAFVIIFTVRDSKLVGRETYQLNAAKSVDENFTSAFLKQHYSSTPNVPKEILVPKLPEDHELISEYLTEVSGHSVKVLHPERGEKRALLQMASKDVVEMVKTLDERAAAAKERRNTLGSEIWDVLSKMHAPGYSADKVYDGRQFRAEAYDISNTNGVDTVGAMVAFNGLKPDRQSYRRFKVRTVTGQDDYSSMREVLSRRFLRLINGDDGFCEVPDILFMDGGKGHVTIATEVLEAADLDIPVVGMVKDDHHRTRALIYKQGEDFVEISLRDKPLLYKYIGTIQEEVHRFVITYHRNLRGKNAQKSLLDEIKGIGLKRRRVLLEEFKSVDNIKNVALSSGGAERLAAIDGMDMRAANSVCQFFREREK
ncbi:MAG: excinuclease ABC subunit UvrC [Firmicutes bacterium]|nr:excinuclease ABC subunit UvrC [Bacillota bacterium]